LDAVAAFQSLMQQQQQAAAMETTEVLAVCY